jgi:predicted RNase H-related nuclease YkuK (DUF458 family)
VEIPERLKAYLNKKKVSISVGKDYHDLKDYLLKN